MITKDDKKSKRQRAAGDRHPPAHPLVSVIMCVYNAAPFLGSSIESILNQGFPNFEFIIIDDGSTDHSLEIIDSYEDSRIIRLSQDRAGLTRSLNRGLRIARGQLIARQDADDISLPDRLERQVAFMDSHQDVALIGSGVTLITETGHVLKDYFYPPHHDRIVKELYQGVNCLPHPTIMFRRDVLNQLGGYDELFLKAQDYAFYLRVIEKFRTASLQQSLVKLRSRMSSVTFSDSEADQLKYCVLARGMAAIGWEKRTSATKAFNKFFQQYEKWFKSSPFPERFAIAKIKRSIRISWHGKDYVKAVKSMISFICRNPMSVVKSFDKNIWSRKIEDQILSISRDCGLLPAVHADRKERARKKRISEWNRRTFHGYVPVEDQFFDMIKRHSGPGKMILDSGAGRGFRYDELYKTGAKIVSTDVDLPTISTNLNTFKLLADAGSMPFKNETFDMIIFKYVFEHLEKPREVLRECFRCLKDNGCVIFLTPNKNSYIAFFSRISPFAWHRLLRKKLLGVDEEDTFPTFYRLNSFRDIKQLMREERFECIEWNSAVGWPSYWEFSYIFYFFFCIIHKLLEVLPFRNFDISLVGCFRKKV